MKKLIFFIAIALFASGISCGKAGKQGDETQVLIKTQFGEIKVNLRYFNKRNNKEANQVEVDAKVKAEVEVEV